MVTKTYAEKMKKFTLLLCIMGTCMKGCQTQQCSPGLTKAPELAFPVCPDTPVTYTCTVAGTNYTSWTGSSFFNFCNDTFNETIISHYYNESVENMENTNFTFINMSECGPFVALRDDAQTTDGCYVSNLEFIASNSPVFNNTSIECLDGNGGEVGRDTVTVAGPPSIPLNLRLSSCDGSARTLTLMWDKPASNGGSEIVRYGLTVEPALPQCSGICYFDASTTQAEFGPLNTSTHYTFVIHAENCNATQQGAQSNITIFYGGPAGPMKISALLVYQDDELESIITTWNEVVPLNISTQCNLPIIGFEVSYISYFKDPVTLNISLNRCLGGICSYVYDIVDFDIPMYTLSVSSRSVLGAGPPTLLDLISARNDFVNFTVNASTPYPEATCQFLCGFDDSAMTAKCDISYSTDVTEIGQSSSSTDEPVVNGSTPGEAISFPLTEPLPPNTVYYYQVDAYTEDQRVEVHGNFTTGNYSDECDPVQLVLTGINITNTNTTTCEDGRDGYVNHDNNLLVCYNGTTHGSIAELFCSKGYNLESESVTQTSTCQVNGLWDYYPTITCQKKRNVGAIVGGTIGGILGLLLIIVVVVVIVILCYKYRQTLSEKLRTKSVTVVYSQYTKAEYGAAEKVTFIEGEDSGELTEITTDTKVNLKGKKKQ